MRIVRSKYACFHIHFQTPMYTHIYIFSTNFPREILSGASVLDQGTPCSPMAERQTFNVTPTHMDTFIQSGSQQLRAKHLASCYILFAYKVLLLLVLVTTLCLLDLMRYHNVCLPFVW